MIHFYFGYKKLFWADRAILGNTHFRPNPLYNKKEYQLPATPTMQAAARRSDDLGTIDDELACELSYSFLNAGKLPPFYLDRWKTNTIFLDILRVNSCDEESNPHVKESVLKQYAELKQSLKEQVVPPAIPIKTQIELLAQEVLRQKEAADAIAKIENEKHQASKEADAIIKRERAQVQAAENLKREEEEAAAEI